MKTERRHELETNSLANWLSEVSDRIRPYGTAIWGLVIGMLVISVAYAYFSRRTERASTEAWNLYYEALGSGAPDPGELSSLGEQFPDSNVGLWSRLMAGDIYLARGMDGLFSDRATANAMLDNAEQQYLAIINAARQPHFVERANLGLGRLYESRGDADSLEKAKEHYGLIGDESPFYEFTQRRIEDLESAETKQFYDWFASRTVTAPTRTPATAGGGIDFDFNSLPDGPAGLGTQFLDLEGDTQQSPPNTVPPVIAPPLTPTPDETDSSQLFPAETSTQTDENQSSPEFSPLELEQSSGEEDNEDGDNAAPGDN